MLTASSDTERVDPEAGVLEMPATIAQLPFFAAGRFPRPDFVGRCVGGTVSSFSGRELVERVRDFALGLESLGVDRGDRVILLSESRPEWLVADFAILTLGAITTPIYPTLSVEQVAFILRDSEASVAIVSSVEQLEKIQAAAAGLSTLRTIVAIDAGNVPGVVAVKAFVDVSDAGHRRMLDGWGVGREFLERAKSVRPDDVATIIYTSGTTGDPKGVMLTHGNLIGNLAGILKVLDLSDTDVALSFLPLCHAFERIVSYVYFMTGISMIFAESIDTVARDLLVVKPTVMTGVPRVFEKLYGRILERGREATGVRRIIFERAIRLAEARGRVLAAGRPLPLAMRVESAVAERLVFAKIRAAVGGRLRYAVSGSAPLNPKLALFFYGLGLPILEGYGLTETSPVLAVMPIREERFGTVGRALPNLELRIAQDGEILARGPNIMLGYYKQPAATSAVLRDGWFHTGDVGEIDADGYVRLTGRKRDVLVTSGGKKVAPQPIEDRLRSHALIEEAVVIGDGRHFIAALIVPDVPALARRLAVSPEDARGRLETPDVRGLFQGAVDGANAGLAQYETIKKFTLIPTPFSLAAGELTPTLKVRRHFVAEKYRPEIDALYGN